MSTGTLPLSDRERTSGSGSRAASGIAMRSDADAAVMRAIETSLAQGRCVLLQIEAWSPDPVQAQRNVRHVLDRIAHVLVKIELLLDRTAAVPA